MAPLSLGPGPVRAWWSGRAQGDQRDRVDGSAPPAPVPPGLVVRRLIQEHGAGVVVLGPDSSAPVPSPQRRGDALVADGTSECLVVLTADCVALALGSPQGVHAAVHVGWRGLRAGVVQEAVAAMSNLGATDVVGAVGPSIRPCCYEFTGPELETLVDRLGPAVRGRTSWDSPALDLVAGVALALGEAGAVLGSDAKRCTGCGPDSFSYRRRRDSARQALFVWRHGDR